MTDNPVCQPAIVSPSKAWLIFILAALFLVYEMGIQVYPAIITEHLLQDLQLDAYGLGLISGIYFYTYTAMQIPAGLLFDRLSIRTVIVLPLLICVLGAWLFSMATTAIQAGLARLLMGTGSAFAFIGVLVVASDLFPPKRFALLAGLAQMLAALGAITGGLPLVGHIENHGWRLPLVILAGFGLLLTGFIWLLVRYPKPQTASKSLSVISGLRLVCRNPQSWYLASYACLLWAPMSAFASLWGVPFLIHYHHLSQTAAVHANSFMWLGIALGSPLLGWWSDYLGKRKLPLLIASWLGFLALSWVIFTSNATSITLSFALFIAGAACAGQALSFAVVKENNLPGTYASAIGFNNMAVVIAGALFQPLIGKLIQQHASHLQPGVSYSYQPSDYLFGIAILPFCFLMASVLCAFFIKEPE